MSITINVNQDNGWDIIEYIGPIDADTEVHLEQLLTKIGSKVKFNLKQVESVNSCGVRSWINLMRELEKANCTVQLEECTSEIVMQMNMIPSFKGNAEIMSVYGSYVCDECGHEEDVLFTKGSNLPSGSNIDLPPKECSSCGAEMELEEVEEEYFAFLGGIAV